MDLEDLRERRERGEEREGCGPWRERSEKSARLCQVVTVMAQMGMAKRALSGEKMDLNLMGELEETTVGLDDDGNMDKRKWNVSNKINRSQKNCWLPIAEE